MPRTDPEGSEARVAALRMLDAVLRRDETLDQSASYATRGLPPADAALARAIAGETLRRLPDLDALIDSRTRDPLPDDAKARMVLRMALAQKIGLGTPDHAVVATALPLVANGPRRLVHGVLSNLLKGNLPEPHAARLPEAIERRWEKAWGDGVVEAARAAIPQRPPLDLSFSEEPQDFDGTRLAPLHRRLEDAGRVEMLPGFADGQWWVQDLAASLPARLVPSEAQRVLDACAAPGGKTMQLAAAGHDVTALDRSEQRMKRLRQNLDRTGLSAEMVVADLNAWRPDGMFDAVLLDAPCSASGTFRRHPEVLYRARDRVVGEMARVQAELLDSAALMVRPGGSLVYATCSLEPLEGEEAVRAFLERFPQFRVVPATSPIEGVEASEEGWIRVLPGMLENVGGLDGFFAAHLVRDGE
ncbi:RsmB/NOP family class I SAM-dependent RNA methyltransferase [Sphingomicrobium lutaoense]|uniref:16S rRNA (Cytosine967-C5)-methyltransferase n=1 Tax=Sphingomicrobium lutaoense TaxID=515949 RepID=A0A839Z2H8_9SPHN|nr:RsmB/NOP family class I SAM-dependent RNA methyltransferase [Sphingomicrobium lutaoense]MBB3764758.1 16S rRNA (cytosine967-C5)-methyltransferase [Sphingomicrobium lutaoense]